MRAKDYLPHNPALFRRHIFEEEFMSCDQMDRLIALTKRLNSIEMNTGGSLETAALNQKLSGIWIKRQVFILRFRGASWI